MTKEDAKDFLFEGFIREKDISGLRDYAKKLTARKFDNSDPEAGMSKEEIKQLSDFANEIANEMIPDFITYGVEVMDHNSEVNRDQCDDEYNLGMVSVVVCVEINGKDFTLDYQTTGTMDYGAISSSLSAYSDTGYDDLKDFVDNDDVFEELIEQIGEDAEVNKKWSEYVNKTYAKDESHFGGIDANSESAIAKKR